MGATRIDPLLAIKHFQPQRIPSNMTRQDTSIRPTRRRFAVLAAAGSLLPKTASGATAAAAGASPCGSIVVSVANLRKSGPCYEEVALYLRLLSSEWLLGSAVSFFGGRQRVTDYVRDLLGYDLLAVGTILNQANPDRIIHAFVYTCGSDLPPGFAALVVNTDGDFFREPRNPDPRVPNLGARRAVILLHELAHALSAPGVLPDREDPTVGLHNTGLVMEKCAGTIAEAARWFHRHGQLRRPSAARVVELPRPLPRAA